MQQRYRALQLFLDSAKLFLSTGDLFDCHSIPGGQEERV
jgi:hypothetical protein